MIVINATEYFISNLSHSICMWEEASRKIHNHHQINNIQTVRGWVDSRSTATNCYQVWHWREG